MEVWAPTAVFLMLALGVRHGLDPEHIAIVNSVTARAATEGRRRPYLTGAWFAFGHGLVITAVAMGLTGLLGIGRMPTWVVTLGAWLPALILFLVATVNLRDLLRPGRDYRPANVKGRLLPRPLRDSASAPAVFIIGMLFAPFVDPATQTAVWGYAVGTSGSLAEVALLGLLLTLSMAVTCMLEARGVLMLMHGDDRDRAQRRHRQVGWVIVVFSYLIVGYTVADALFPDRGWQAHLSASVALAIAMAGVVAAAVGLLARWPRGAT